MKTIVKIILFVAITIIPTFSHAQSSQIQADTLPQTQMEADRQDDVALKYDIHFYKEETNRLDMINIHEKDKRRDEMKANRAFYDTFLGVSCLALIAVCAIMLFRNQRRRNEQEKELIDKLIDKGVFTQAQPENLELLLTKEKNVTTNKNFITDATLIGAGFGLLQTALNDITNFVGSILLFIGVVRIVVRAIISITKAATAKNKQVAKNFMADTATHTETESSTEEKEKKEPQQ